MTGTAVAKTIAAGFADPAQVTQVTVLAALMGASLWNLLTWWWGIPSSSSHALIGGLAGAVVARGGLRMPLSGRRCRRRSCCRWWSLRPRAL